MFSRVFQPRERESEIEREKIENGIETEGKLEPGERCPVCATESARLSQFSRDRGGRGEDDPLGKIHHAARHSSGLSSIVRDSRIADYRCSNGREGPSRSRPGPPISPVLEGSLLLRPPHFLRTFLSGPLFLFLFLSYSLASIRVIKCRARALPRLYWPLQSCPSSRIPRRAARILRRSVAALLTAGILWTA